jgi:hypothetical protein
MSNQRDGSCWELWEGLREIIEAAGLQAPPRSREMRFRAYQRFSTGLTFREIAGWMWSPSDDPSTWRGRSRGPVLGLWWRTKQDLWAEKARREDEALAAVGGGE